MNKITRRQFWRISPTTGLKTALAGENSGSNTDVPAYLRPPGALTEPEFLTTCERCSECADACPHDVITELGPEAGKSEGTPILNPETAPCHWCPTFDCIDACPSGALTLGDGATPASIGKAKVNLASCLVSQGILCDVCVYRCPPTIRAIRLENRFPVIDAAACVGCGLCSYYCAAETTAIAITPIDGSADA